MPSAKHAKGFKAEQSQKERYNKLMQFSTEDQLDEVKQNMRRLEKT